MAPKIHRVSTQEDGQALILLLILSFITIPFHSHTTRYRSLPLLAGSLLTVHIEQGPERTHEIVYALRFAECLFVLLSRSESDAAVTVQYV